MLVGWADQEKTGQVGVLVEEWPRVGIPGEDWRSEVGVPEEDLRHICRRLVCIQFSRS